ncbi:hypothetical protein FIBSPDRAFT_867089 [Athelia psychrophila]|uniref:Uncharacterized protein n=1 Tax=Athelia psychrophila TaxID=1759441 RepID=A0A165WIP1_9AGAM|nr:hypothetical protein FIBSPDRAFT_875320 [Fibularhizoctonia sp. CBS 109695]KZP15521.1 hypothetical protein FIBSPDRAFT_867089 [Fibularhizoctonia sp. CBS 109695]
MLRQSMYYRDIASVRSPRAKQLSSKPITARATCPANNPGDGGTWDVGLEMQSTLITAADDELNYITL